MQRPVHWAVITHRHGVTVYLAATDAALMRRVAEYAVEWSGEAWDVLDEDAPDDADEYLNPVERAYKNGDYAGAVETYFDVMSDYEGWETGMNMVDFPLADDPHTR